MRTTAFLITLFAPSTFAFNVTLHQTSECKGPIKIYELLKVEDGCHKLEEAANDKALGIAVQWTDKPDNDLSVALFNNENCCNGDASSSVGWSDGCSGLQSIKSFRIMDPSDINKGKEGERYECKNGPDDPKLPFMLSLIGTAIEQLKGGGSGGERGGMVKGVTGGV